MWISVKEELPQISKHTLFRVRVVVGSVKKDEREAEIYATPASIGVRWGVGDWTEVTHWWRE